MPVANTNSLLIYKPGLYIGFESGVFCRFPLNKTPIYYSTSRQLEGYKCYCDEMGNCYYSPTCRPWYESQRASPNTCSFQDLYLYSQSS